MSKIQTQTPATVKEIHNAFSQECVAANTKYRAAIQGAGFELLPPLEYQKYFPFHKIIHLNKIMLLCEKYNLLFSQTKNFVGEIPLKNQAELAEFMDTYNYVHSEGYPHCNFFKYFIQGVGPVQRNFIRATDKPTLKEEESEPALEYYIVAPKSMIATQKMKKNRIVTDDPIIIGMIRPHHGVGDLNWGNIKWGVIITAWGDEASDEIVVNQNMN